IVPLSVMRAPVALSGCLDSVQHITGAGTNEGVAHNTAVQGQVHVQDRSLDGNCNAITQSYVMTNDGVELTYQFIGWSEQYCGVVGSSHCFYRLWRGYYNGTL